MTALVDIGNSNIVLSIADGEDFVHTWRIGSDTRRTGDEYYVIFRSLLDGAGVELSSVDRAALSSVVPNLTLSIGKVLQRLFSLVPMIFQFVLYAPFLDPLFDQRESGNVMGTYSPAPRRRGKPTAEQA